MHATRRGEGNPKVGAQRAATATLGPFVHAIAVGYFFAKGVEGGRCSATRLKSGIHGRLPKK